MAVNKIAACKKGANMLERIVSVMTDEEVAQLLRVVARRMEDTEISTYHYLALGKAADFIKTGAQLTEAEANAIRYNIAVEGYVALPGFTSSRGKIGAIKSVRRRSELGLAAAKAVVEQWCKRNGF